MTKRVRVKSNLSSKLCYVLRNFARIPMRTEQATLMNQRIDIEAPKCRGMATRG